MPSFLVNRKMSPELRARVLASVCGGKRPTGARLSANGVMLLRGAALFSILAAVAFFAVSKQQADDEVAAARARVLERWRAESQPLNLTDHAQVKRVMSLLKGATAKYAGDYVSDQVKNAAGLEKTLRRRLVYVRGPIEGFRQETTLEATALNSVKDVFVFCLLKPSAERTEKQLLRKVRSVYAGSDDVRRATAHVQRLGDAFVGLPLLKTEFRQRVLDAPDLRELGMLRQTLERAPLDGARRAARAELLLLVLDEPGDKQAPTELDGERPHQVRVALMDIKSRQPLVRLRRPVDPSWLSDTTRSEYARGVDSCALAFDVRKAILEG